MSNNDPVTDAVTKELGEAAGVTKAGVANVSAELAEAASSAVDDGGDRPSKTKRQQKAQSGRERAQQRKKEKDAEDRRRVEELGAVPPDTDLDDPDMEDYAGGIPRDADGNPKWFLSRRTGRVVRANHVNVRPEMRMKMQLMPCREPKSVRAAREAQAEQ